MERKVTKPKKAKVLTSTRGEQVGIVTGNIAGIPASLATAIASLRDVLSRCEVAGESTGILDAAQANTIKGLEDRCRSTIRSAESWAREIDAMVRAGIALPAKDELELV